MTQHTRQVYSVRQLAERWDCSAPYIYGLIKKGHLAATKFSGKLIRIKLAEVERYEDEGPCQKKNTGSEGTGENTPPSGKTKTEIDSAARSARQLAARTSGQPGLRLLHSSEQ